MVTKKHSLHVLRWVLAPLGGMAVLVAWGMVFWGLAADPLGVFHKLPNDHDVTAVLLAGDAPTGTYFMPWPRRTSEEFAAFENQHKSGPFYRLHLVREGVHPGSPLKLAVGCLHYLSVAALATLLVALIGAASQWKCAAVVVLGGLLGTNLITLGDPIWFHMPWDYTLGVLLYESVAWLLLGLTVGLICPASPGACHD